MPSIAVDFDGVIEHYTPGIASENVFGAPIDGAREAIRKLKLIQGYRIIIWTSRPITTELHEWLEYYNILYDEIVQKPDCSIFVDDRAIRFTGDWTKTLDEINAFVEWWNEDNNNR